MPERALLRFKREGIAVYHAKKVKKNQILFSVSRKDSEKVFAIYPNVCYNISVYHPFTVKKVGSSGIATCFDFLKRRLGLLLGGLLFAVLLLFSDMWIFSVDHIGTDIYRRETLAALEESGITPFCVYRKGKEDEVCARILALDGVEFCSLQKSGHRLLVEVRLSPFALYRVDKENMVAKHSGTLLSITALKGTPLKKAGEEVRCGETLVENRFYTEDGGQVCVEPIARASIACVLEETFEAETAEEAFAAAYLKLQLSDRDRITESSIIGENGLFQVKIGYTVIETINLTN